MTALIIRGGTVVNHDHSRTYLWTERRLSRSALRSTLPLAPG
jgi:hypothetical protein